MDKQALRERVWDELDESGEARFPFPPHGRIPNFAGARAAADRLADAPEWREARTVKANPDAPQLPVRRRALRDGKTVYVAVPRLADEDCFLELDPDRIDPADYDAAPALSNVDDHAAQVGPEAVPGIDLVVSGSVAVTGSGARVGKGEGYSDLEFAILRELGLVGAETPVATTVHEQQVVDEDVATEAHDVPMDLVVTPERVIRPADERDSGATDGDGGATGEDGDAADGDAAARKPTGIDWSLLDEERVAEIPVLAGLRE